MSLIRIKRQAVPRIRCFPRAKAGNVSIIFAFSLVPLIGLLGLGTDYGIALNAKTRLDNAADLAAVTAVAAAKAYVSANPNDTNLDPDAIAAGIERATRAFKINASNVAFAPPIPTPVITLSRTKQTFSSSVTYTSYTNTQFGRLFGQSMLTVTGLASAKADIPSYLDFYLLVDVSGSMGLPSTDAGQSKLMSLNGNCQFACHFAGVDAGYNTAMQYNIQLRSGAVNTAVCQLLTQAASSSVPNQYRVGIFPFVTQMATLAPLSSNVASTLGLADCSSAQPMAFNRLLDTGSTQLFSNNNPATGTGSGGTHFETTLPSIQAAIQSVGDGSAAAKPRPFVFLVTDGMSNTQRFAVRSGSTYYYVGNPSLFPSTTTTDASWDGPVPSAINPALCNAVKSMGVTLSILYIPYLPLAVTSQNTWETIAANNAIGNLAPNLQQCATSGFFYTANTPKDISDALNAMFSQAVQVAHLTQ